MTTLAKRSTSFGILLIDKPAGWTSFDVVAKLRRITGVKKIGHAGTLDPFATGLLIVAVGKEATKNIDQFVKLDKTYEATFVLGATSTTHDPEGRISLAKNEETRIEKREVEQALAQLTGTIEQIPPMHSAIKVNGQRLYKLAREGKEIEREPRRVTVHTFEVLDYAWPKLRVHILCSSGTYIRALARDLGTALGVGAYVSELRRTRIGDFSIDNAVALDTLTPENWHSHIATCSRGL